jgi:hypothetical protein
MEMESVGLDAFCRKSDECVVIKNMTTRKIEWGDDEHRQHVLKANS